MNIKITILITAILNFYLSWIIYFKDKKKLANIFFASLTLAAGMWSITIYLYEFPIILSSLFWIKMAYFLGIIAFISLFCFSFVFPVEKINVLKKTFILCIIPTLVIFYYLFFTKLLVGEVKENSLGIISTKLGSYYSLFVIYVMFFVSWCLYNFISNYMAASGVLKMRLKYLFLGIILSAIGIISVDFLLPLFTNNTVYFWTSPIFSLFFIGFTAYAIVTKELFGIKAILTTLFVTIIAILLLLDTLIFTTNLTLQLFKGLILIIFLYFGYLLINSVLEEIQRREEIERLSRAKSEFISIASHQLRSPLTAIKGYISMLLEGTYGELTERAKKPIKNVSQSSERLIKLVNDLLSISRIEAGKIEMKLEKTSLEDIISGVVEELVMEAKNKKIYLKWEKPKKALPETLIDKNKIRQVLSNVVDNAIRYTNKGGVNIKLKSQNSKFKIEVIDTGAGMTHEELDKMFESFSRGVAGTRLYTEGVGLGLYISRKFIEMHNGKIWAESPGRGKGSTFHIEIPIK